MKAIQTQSEGAFWTASYGAFRWHESTSMHDKPGTWILISAGLEFDRFRDLKGKFHVTCVVDDFGNLVRVAA
jgi:hypothetical protein